MGALELEPRVGQKWLKDFGTDGIVEIEIIKIDVSARAISFIARGESVEDSEEPRRLGINAFAYWISNTPDMAR